MKDQDGQHLRPLEVQFGFWHEGMFEVSGPDVKEGMEVIVGEGPSPAATGKQPAPAAKTPAAPLSINVSRPVVREISDYAEFAGRIEAAPAGMTVQQDSAYVRAIYVAFDVDERTVLRLRRAARQDSAKGRREPDYAVLCAVADEVGYPHRGKLASTGESVDPATGTAHWRAMIPNPSGILLPGMFARVRLITGAPHKALLVAESAVRSDPRTEIRLRRHRP